MSRTLNQRIAESSENLWQKQKERERLRKIEEQAEIREMFEKYWPWGRSDQVQPRGLRNLRLEELFPDGDFRGPTSRGGGGAPLVKAGRKVTRTKVDPLLRFRLGDNNLRRCVDNTLRYRTDPQQQQAYKKELDVMVEEKKQRKLREQLQQKEEERAQLRHAAPWGSAGPGGRPWRPPEAVGAGFKRSMGCTNGETLESLASTNKENTSNSHPKPNFTKIRLDPLPKRAFVPACKSRKPSAISENAGIELVPLMAKTAIIRRDDARAPLCSTDVTSEKKLDYECLWDRRGSAYLKELAQQVKLKETRLRAVKEEENERSLRHFSTWAGFWGRPGHGAPQVEHSRKSDLDRLLYPRCFPVGVH